MAASKSLKCRQHNSLSRGSESYKNSTMPYELPPKLRITQQFDEICPPTHTHKTYETLCIVTASKYPAKAVGFLRAKKIPSTPSFGREVKPFVPCRRFTARKRSLNVTWKSGIFRQNSSAISRPLSLLGSLVETPGGASRKD